MELCHQVMSLLFNILPICHRFPSKEQTSFNFMAVVTICSDFGALDPTELQSSGMNDFNYWSPSKGRQIAPIGASRVLDSLLP